MRNVALPSVEQQLHSLSDKEDEEDDSSRGRNVLLLTSFFTTWIVRIPQRKFVAVAWASTTSSQTILYRRLLYYYYYYVEVSGLRKAQYCLCDVSSAAVPQPVDWFRRSRRDPSPTLLCAGAMHSSQLFSVRIISRFTLGALHLHKCWITLCWCTKYPSKHNLPLPLLARKRDNRQSDS